MLSLPLHWGWGWIVTFYDELDDVRHLPNDVFKGAGVNAPVRAVQLPHLHAVTTDSHTLPLLQQL